jgi:hypothetical protein
MKGDELRLSEQSIVAYVGARSTHRASWIKNTALFLFKLAVTGACFWYVARQVDIAYLGWLLDTFDFAWGAFATFTMVLVIALVAWRWREIINTLGSDVKTTPLGPIIAITAIGVFFGQILPNIASEAVRVWLLARLGCGSRRGVPSVLIDAVLVSSFFWSSDLSGCCFPRLLPR